MKKNSDEQVMNSSGSDAEEMMSAPDEVEKNTRNQGGQDPAGEKKSADAQKDAGGEPADILSGDDSGENRSSAENAAPADRLEELEKKNAELQDQYLRKAADFDNYRKRMIREKQEAIDYANSALLLDLVQVLDDFDRAIDAGSAGDQGEQGAFTDGVSMIRKQLGSLLESKYGLEYYPAKDTAFDPNIHEAIGTVPDPGVKEPTVAEEYLKGYKLRGRVIRPAKVMVKMPQDTAAE